MPSQQRERLRQQELRVKARIKRCDAREGEQNKKRDTRRKVLIGAAILAKVERGDWSEEGFLKMMDAFLFRPSERSLFGLPILEEASERSGESSPENSDNDLMDDLQINEDHPELSVT
jgi:hypothetical protein